MRDLGTRALEHLSRGVITAEAEQAARDVLDRFPSVSARRLLLELHPPGPQGRVQTLDFAFSLSRPEHLLDVADGCFAPWDALLAALARWWTLHREIAARVWLAMDTTRAAPVTRTLPAGAFVSLQHAPSAAQRTELATGLAAAFRPIDSIGLETWFRARLEAIGHERLIQIGAFDRPNGREARALYRSPPLPSPADREPNAQRWADLVHRAGLGLVVQLVHRGSSTDHGAPHLEITPAAHDAESARHAADVIAAEGLLESTQVHAIAAWCTTANDRLRPRLNHIKVCDDGVRPFAKIYLACAARQG